MKNLINSLILGFFFLTIFPSCKAYRYVENLKPTVPKEERTEVFDVSSLDKLVKDDLLLIDSKDKKTQYVIFNEVEGEILVGSIWKEGKRNLKNPTLFEIPITAIESLRVRRVSTGATIGGIVFGGIIGAFLFYVIAVSLGEGMNLGGA